MCYERLDARVPRGVVPFVLGYAGYVTRSGDLPVFGLEIGYGDQDDLLDVSRGALLR